MEMFVRTASVTREDADVFGKRFQASLTPNDAHRIVLDFNLDERVLRASDRQSS